jgi:cell division protein FtsI (penicillin-binding protein 3)
VFNKYVDSIAVGLANVLKEKTAKEYAANWKKLRFEARKDKQKSTHRYESVTPKTVDYITLQKLKKMPLLKERPNKGGLKAEPTMERVRPYKDMALNTLGWVNATKGGVGVEFSYQDDIAGKPGWELRRRVGKNTFAPISNTPEVPPVDGCDIVTTLDIDLQQIVEDAVKRQLAATTDLEWGTAVVMDVKTGEVRAIANKHKIKETGEITEDENYALRYRKDPGSTFKLVSFMIMLEKGLSLDTTVDTKDGSITLYGKKYEDESKKGRTITAAEVFEHSSNVGTIELTMRMYPNKKNWDDFLDRIETLKIKEITDFDIKPQQDITPIIRMKKDDGRALYAMSIGTSLEMTPLQTLTIYNAVANDGCMVHPRFIKEIRKDGRVIRETKSINVINKAICSQKTLAKLQQILIGVVEHGTGKSAKSEIFTVAGKTGTAHIAEGSKGYTQKKLASFAGYFPAEAPKYSCIVAFRTFETSNKTYGGKFAAPVFKDIAEKIYAHAVDWQTPADAMHSVTEAPYTKSGSSQALFRTLDRLKIAATDNENSDWVTTSSIDNTVQLQPRGLVKGLVPDVKNMGLKDAVFLLENNGMRVRFAGRGTVIQQIPAAGSPYETGDAVRLVMSQEQ